MASTIIRGLLSQNSKAVRKNTKLKELAERYLKHEFDVLGSGWVKVFHGMTAAGFEGKNFSTPFTYEKSVKEIPAFWKKNNSKIMTMAKTFRKNYTPIDWQLDFKSGFRYSAGVHHSELKYGVTEGVDAKVTADLGRLYQLVVLAKAYCAYREKKYLDEYNAQLLDFIASNPPEYGASWRANMNVSIRIANIIVSLDLLGKNNPLKPEFENLLKESFMAHGKYIMANLEFPQNHYHPNHFIANLAGLLILSSYIKDWCGEAVEWYEYSLKTLSEEILNQTYEDGANYENASSYHCLVLEMISASMIFAAKTEGAATPVSIRKWIENKAGAKAVKRLEKMYAAMKSIIQPNGLIPLVGDNDSGRFILLEEDGKNKRDWRFLSVVGSALFENEELLATGKEFKSNSLYAEIIFGKRFSGKNGGNALSSSYPDAGYYIMRNDDEYIFINCGQVGTGGKGGHSHNDKLGIIMTLDGHEIFTDPGIYVYTAGRFFRNRYRSTHTHNTLSYNGEEQNRYLENSPWWGCHEDTRCECVKWECKKDRNVFAGRHHGFERLENPVTHQRTIDWNRKNKLISVTDELFPLKKGLEAKGATVGFNLTKDCIITEYSQKDITVEVGNLKIKIQAESGYWTTEPFYYSPEYGMKIYSQRLVLNLPSGCAKNTVTIKYS